MADADGKPKEAWHLDKRVPLALIVTILVQTAGFGLWMGQTQQRIANLEAWVTKNDRMGERIAVIESQTADIRDTLARIDNKIDARSDLRFGQ